MGRSHSKPASSLVSEITQRKTWRDQWRDTRKSILPNFGHSVATTAEDVPKDNIFVPIQQDSILPQVPIGRHHPVPLTGIEDDDMRTLHTNKFYANAFLGKQDQPIWTHPYAIWWGKGSQEPGVLPTWGMNVSHVEEDDIIFGPEDPAKSYAYPRKQSVILSARELELASTFLTTDSHMPFSVNINLNHPASSIEPRITFPLVQGMPFVTAGYRGATPTIQTGGKGFKEFSGPFLLARAAKYHLKDIDGRSWIIYINPLSGLNYETTRFVRLDPNTLLGPAKFVGTIQVAKNPIGAEGEIIYDKAAGGFASHAKLSAVVNDMRGSYSFHYTKIGTSPLLMFALPHHLQSLEPDPKIQVTNLRLRTTTKGMATAVWTEKLTLTEVTLPSTMTFAPWNPSIQPSAKTRYPPDVLAFIGAVAERDLRRVMTEMLNPDSFYYAGKTLAKFATIVWVIKEVLSNDAQANAGLDKLKQLVAKYILNQQRWPIYYDDSWKGAVSNIGFNDPGADFGNTYYNDHHFHWGYMIYACAIIGFLDPDWVNQGDNKAWVNMLVKDFAESDYNGRDYPFFRSFDWWHGHSWAKGLFESADGKDQESTSEDGLASLAMKMWGKVIGDQNMEKRGNLMLAIQTRSFNNYFYLQSNNSNHPPRFIQNKITGILFENKVDYTTYFGALTSFIHGIHTVSINPSTSYLRSRAFVKEEWDRFFSDGRINAVEGGWRGILYANYAIVDAKVAYAFFRDGVDGYWDDGWIDPGASRCWYLVWCWALGEGKAR